MRGWARERGATHLELDSAEARLDAHRFYEREGADPGLALFSVGPCLTSVRRDRYAAPRTPPDGVNNDAKGRHMHFDLKRKTALVAAPRRGDRRLRRR